MVRVGVHVSIAGSLDLAVDRAKETGCDVFQMFSRNPRGWGYKPLLDRDCETYKGKVQATGIIPVDHMPYLPNLASPKPDIYEKSIAALTAELDRAGRLGIPYLVTHLGHHLGDGIAGGRARVIRAINTALGESDTAAILLLENTAGRRTVSAAVSNIYGASWTGLKITAVQEYVLTHVMRLPRDMSCARKRESQKPLHSSMIRSVSAISKSYI